LIGGAAFAAVSIAAADSVNPQMLIIGRVLLGIAGATLMPSTLALISNMFRDDRQLSRPSRCGPPARSRVGRLARFSAGSCCSSISGGVRCF
jgi:DHA2 family multidrug resistance protein-like MFS transporter